MSAISTRIANSRTTTAAAARARTTGQSAPRVRLKVRAVPQASPAVYALRKIAVFGAFMFMGFVGSTISGQVMLEKVRNDGMHARQLSMDARKVENAVHRQVDTLMSAAVIEQWAVDHGFVAPDAQVEAKEVSNLVARKD